MFSITGPSPAYLNLKDLLIVWNMLRLSAVLAITGIFMGAMTTLNLIFPIALRPGKVSILMCGPASGVSMAEHI
jgi:hypothetical protein